MVSSGWHANRIRVSGNTTFMAGAKTVWRCAFEAALGFATNAGNLRLEMQDYLEDPRNKKKPTSHSDSLLSELTR